MATYTARVRWQRGDQKFTDNRYSRAHTWKFDGGTEVPASASPHVVPLPMSAEAAVDPEEAFVASVSSCHMLWFLSVAAKRGYIVDSYTDDAEGVMEMNATGKIAITKVTLRPLAVFSVPKVPDRTALDELHHAAHEQCFIANSIRSEVACEPRLSF
jgi:organic hydroperoxide reductase OsmC/OhrA